jgi:hypothetical protein
MITVQQRKISRLEGQLAAARRLLRRGSYNHYYCNVHEGERDAHEGCPGCLAHDADMAIVFGRH